MLLLSVLQGSQRERGRVLATLTGRNQGKLDINLFKHLIDAAMRASTLGQGRLHFFVFKAKRHNASADVRQAVTEGVMSSPASFREKAFVQLTGTL